MDFLRQWWKRWTRTFHTKREQKLAGRGDDLDQKLTAALTESNRLRESVIAVSAERDNLLRELASVKSQLITSQDEVQVLNRRVELLNLGYRANRDLVVEILSTKNGINDGGSELIDADGSGHAGSG